MRIVDQNCSHPPQPSSIHGQYSLMLDTGTQMIDVPDYVRLAIGRLHHFPKIGASLMTQSSKVKSPDDGPNAEPHRPHLTRHVVRTKGGRDARRAPNEVIPSSSSS